RVCVSNEKFDTGFAEVTIIAWNECTFSQPDTARRPSEMFNIIFTRDLDLRAFGRLVRHQRQKPMGRRAGDDLQMPGILQFAKSANDVALVNVFEYFAAFVEVTAIHQRR